jgi:hypothetical protein
VSGDIMRLSRLMLYTLAWLMLGTPAMLRDLNVIGKMLRRAGGHGRVSVLEVAGRHGMSRRSVYTSNGPDAFTVVRCVFRMI